jgi:hypothetical protein
MGTMLLTAAKPGLLLCAVVVCIALSLGRCLHSYRWDVVRQYRLSICTRGIENLVGFKEDMARRSPMGSMKSMKKVDILKSSLAQHEDSKSELELIGRGLAGSRSVNWSPECKCTRSRRRNAAGLSLPRSRLLSTNRCLGVASKVTLYLGRPSLPYRRSRTASARSRCPCGSRDESSPYPGSFDQRG